MFKSKVFIEVSSPVSRAKSDQIVDLLIFRQDVREIRRCAGRNDMGLNYRSPEI